jgi:hypothetical protein
MPELLAILRRGQLATARRFRFVCERSCALATVVRVGPRLLVICHTRLRVTSGEAYGPRRHADREVEFRWLTGLFADVSCRHRHGKVMEIWVREQMEAGRRRAVLPYVTTYTDGTPVRTRGDR